MDSPLPSPSATTLKNAHRELQDEAFDELAKLSLREILDQDSRPTFILDLDPDDVAGRPIQPIYCNAALMVHGLLLESITGADAEIVSDEGAGDTTTYDEFQDWVTSISRHNDSKDIFPLTFHYQGLLWTGFTVQRRWRIISGNALFQASNIPKVYNLQTPPTYRFKSSRSGTPKARYPSKKITSAAPISSHVVLPSVAQKPESVSASLSKHTSRDTSKSGASVTLSTSNDAVSDWTNSKLIGTPSEHVMFTRNFDWASTPLGPMAKWSVQFREVVNLVMRNPHPCSLFWGEELTMIYNEAYKNEVAGNKHPDLMGTGFSGPFSEVWDGVASIFRECARTGQSFRKENDCLPIERYGYLEETFFSWSLVPVYAGTDRILGFYNAPFETTSPTINDRRMQMLRHLGECLNAARTVKDFWRQVLNGLEHNHFDVPFALLYSVSDADDAETASRSSDSTICLKSCLLEGSIGLPEGHAASPYKFDLKRSREGFIPAFIEAMKNRGPTTLQIRDGTLPESLLEGIDWRGYGDPCKEAIIFPIRPTNGETVFAVLLIGVNPRRAYDDEYKSFATMLNRQLATSLASVVLFEDEVRRSRIEAETAAQQRDQLYKQLELETNRMRRMTELSPLGMYLFDPEGVLLEANDRYFEMTGIPKEDAGELGFMNIVASESQEVVKGMWDEMMATFKPSAREIQLSKAQTTPRDPSGNAIEYWVLATSQPELGPNGELISIMGSIADISHMKWAQALQQTRLREAEETKRQQNEFIDITSHEMRNPLSAILICADDIRDTLTQHEFRAKDRQVIAECIEAANNIALCVQHQKSIVDDILTISKLDSKLLLITPVLAQPVVVVQRAMSMFYPECKAKDIDFRLMPHESIQRLKIEWVLIDPTRLLQITVNLIANAIKFTQYCDRRSILVHMSVSPDHPELAKDFEYVPTRNAPVHLAFGEDSGPGQLLYLHVDVEDTGVGLTTREKARLFERFGQASPRTHAHYGGSGLGLFISRQLAELHGGQIGVSSQSGAGSTFGFFLQCKHMTSGSSHSQLSQQTSTHALPLAHAKSSLEPSRSISNRFIQVENSGIKIPTSSHLDEKLHILIVEDNLVNQKVLAKQLIKAGCVVNTADNGLLALDYLSRTWFHTSSTEQTPLSLVLMDWEMPEMDGLTCCRHIRAMEERGELNGHVPVIAVTANVRAEQIAIAKESGMDDIISKPFRIPELLEKVEGVLKRQNEAGQR